jgi:phosphoserine aminotransferase
MYFCNVSSSKRKSINMKKHNFSSGPAILPQIVFEQAAQACIDLDGIGLSVLEISHRSPEFTSVLQEAEQLTKELLGVPENYAVLFLTGGASSQFFMTAMNLLGEGQTAGYVDTGSWSAKAIKEAKLFGQVEVLASSKDKNYTYIPKGFDIPSHLSYVHLTSNNTIYGTQFKDWPPTDLPFVCDMSSDIFSRPIDMARFGLIYAGAQKNMGPAGVTLVIVREDLLGKVERAIPTMLDYQTHIKKQSSFNTPPVFPIYVSMLNMRWLKTNGGVQAMQAKNEQKAALLYEEIDRNTCFVGTTAKEDRSTMNATFVTTDAQYDEPFLESCKQAGISGIKGHRSVGGFRASMYNAMEMSSVELLVEVMKDFEKKLG